MSHNPFLTRPISIMNSNSKINILVTSPCHNIYKKLSFSRVEIIRKRLSIAYNLFIELQTQRFYQKRRLQICYQVIMRLLHVFFDQYFMILNSLIRQLILAAQYQNNIKITIKLQKQRNKSPNIKFIIINKSQFTSAVYVLTIQLILRFRNMFKIQLNLAKLAYISPSIILSPNYLIYCKIFFLQIQTLIKSQCQMSLFIGNVSKKVTLQQFQDSFKSYGNCKIDLRKRYAFVQFDSERCAQQAKQALQNTNFSGLRLNIEWSKNSGRFNENNRSKNDRTRRRRSNSREREQPSWRKQERYFRRSPSYERRAPTYSQNEQQIQKFQPKCPRDHELLRRLKVKFEEKQAPRQPDSKMELEAGQAI